MSCIQSGTVLISADGFKQPLWRKSHPPVCKKSSLQAPHTSGFHNFHLLQSALSPLLGAIANFWIKFLPNVLCHFPFPTTSAGKKKISFQGCTIVGHRKRKRRAKMHCTEQNLWVWAVSFDSTSIILNKSEGLDGKGDLTQLLGCTYQIVWRWVVLG